MTCEWVVCNDSAARLFIAGGLVRACEILPWLGGGFTIHGVGLRIVSTDSDYGWAATLEEAQAAADAAISRLTERTPRA